MKLRMLVLALATAAASAATVVTTAGPAGAGNACPSSDPLTVNTAGVSGVVSTADPQDWYTLTVSTPAEVRLWAGSSTNGSSEVLKIHDAGCTAPVCDFPVGGGDQICDVVAGTYSVGAALYAGSSIGYRLTAKTLDCGDGVDNDGDGRTDYPADPGCSSQFDSTENSEPQCSNNLDDDGDGAKDYPADLGCSSATDKIEGSSQCSDGVDNDGDGFADYPADAGCVDGRDDSEGVSCSVTAGVTVCAGTSTGNEIRRVSLGAPTTNEHVVGYLDTYRFVVAGDVLALACPVLGVNASVVNPCALAGGTFLSRDRTLVDDTVAVPVPGLGGPTTVGVCEAELQLTADGIGVPSARIYGLC